jgi:putative YhdH/YhfP family quinone oxidoreductase
MSSFKAYLISEVDGKTQSAFVDMDEAQLDAGEVTIKVAYSSVNYKDALAATGAGRIIRRYPCVGGVDLCGIVTQSGDARFKAGDAVIATSFDIGVAHHGGYAELARVPADWVVPLPAGLTLREAMALGTAGFTAALAIVRMEENGLTPSRGTVIVSGATGGVGGLAVDMLAGLGYKVTALTGKEAEFDYLKRLGASEVMYRSALDLTRIRPLDKALWAGAVDSLGGEVLAWMASTMKPAGTIASIGLAAGTALNTTVMPFILRGVSLLGIDSVNAGEPYRSGIWQRLASDLKPRHLLEMTHSVAFADLPGVFDSFLKGRSRGRVVVELAGSGSAAS